MRFFAAVDALPSLESMKFPVFSLLAGNFGLFRDEFAPDSPLQRGVRCELDLGESGFADETVPQLRSRRSVRSGIRLQNSGERNGDAVHMLWVPARAVREKYRLVG